MNYTRCVYPKIDGKITEIFGTRKNFAKALKTSENSVANKLMGKTPWKMDEAKRTCELLNIPHVEFWDYFFN